MCLITFAFKKHAEYPLILVANRDEFYGRETQAAKEWHEEGYPNIIAGKDLRAGGTWMGINKNGRWAALTNYRDIDNIKENAPSRGDLVLNFLKSDGKPEDYLTELDKISYQFNGFNLLIGDSKTIHYYSNYGKKIVNVNQGFHGLSNAHLNTPWKKTSDVTQRLKSLVEDDVIEPNSFFEIMSDETKADEKTLPQTGLPLKMEKAISSIFINTPDYGTRCTTILLQNKDGDYTYIERRFKPGSKEIIGESIFEFKI